MYGAWLPAGRGAGGTSSAGADKAHVQSTGAEHLLESTAQDEDIKQANGASGMHLRAGGRANDMLLGMATGPTVTFNLVQPDGTYVGYGEVGSWSSLKDIWW
jgi:hypothetical protein